MTYEKFSAPLEMGFPDEWYDVAGAEHFWVAWRMRVLSRLLRQNKLPVDQPLRVMEVGAGRGTLRAQIERDTGWIVDGADINAAALSDAPPARGRTLLYDVRDRLAQWREGYDVIILFDVLEHIEEPAPFLQACDWHLRKGGWMILNVPALPAFYSRFDKVVGHFRRYTPSMIRESFQSGMPDTRMLDVRYWGLSLLPLAALRKLLIRDMKPQAVVRFGLKPPAQWINSGLRLLMNVETACIARPPLGASLMALGQKV